MYIGDGNVTFESFIIPTSIVAGYASPTNNVAFGIDSTRLGNRVYALATYKSDTRLYMQVTTNYYCTIFGVR